ncbi:patatin-like phospholipase family protein [Ideonella alba]|uniref:Patatin-like phospholipase family protein n=1 Tax=Ideonella alba TaxID=2824118 RepID=A0A941BH22_9BURK|nr:patatin-like phospholipase family protein [Ideonella alba]MBQ0931158.1 patatin-like phospholipase family protein [Ideonella alba]
MADDGTNLPTLAELKGEALMTAFGLTPPDRLDRDQRRWVDLHTLLDRVDVALEEAGVKATEGKDDKLTKRLEKYRQAHTKLTEEFVKVEVGDRPGRVDELAKKARTLYDQVNAEAYEGARITGIQKALGKFMEHQGVESIKLGKTYTEKIQKIAKIEDPVERIDQYYELEKRIIASDLAAREQDEPGSTWQLRVDQSLSDANPKNKKAHKIKVDSGDLTDAEIGFLNAGNKKIEEAMFSVPARFQDEFRRRAGDALRNLIDSLFHGDHPPTNRQQLGQLMVEANTRLLQLLVGLKREYPPEAPPSARVRNGKLVLTKAAPKVQSLVMQGGGGKGVGYPPMLEEMNKAGTLKKVDLLVGTSIGALNATCLACGGLNDERQLLDLDPLEQALDPRHKKKERYPGVSFKGDVWPSCAGQMAKMDELTAMSIADGVKDYSEGQLGAALLDKLAELDDDTLQRLGLSNPDPAEIEAEVAKLAKKVKNQDLNASDRTSQMITFKDLAILHQLDPVNFKELTITGWEGTGDQGHTVYFNAKDFPDMPVALAARISMGLPIISPLYWKGRGPFYDGGLGSNAPVEATPGLDKFYEGKDPADAELELHSDDIPIDVQKAMAQTMLMTFDDEGKGTRNLYGDGRETTNPSTGEKITVMGKGGVFDDANPEYDETLRKDASKVYNGGVNTLQVYHADQGTLSLGPLGGNPDEVEYAENMSRMKGLEQLDQRSDQAVEMNCGSVLDALEAMTPAEIRRMLAEGPPDPNADPLLLALHEGCESYVLVTEALGQFVDDAGPALELLRESPLCVDCVGAVDLLIEVWASYDDIDTPELQPRIELISQASGAIARLPSCLRAIVTKTVLLPLQKDLRQARADLREATQGDEDDQDNPGGEGQGGDDVAPQGFVWSRMFVAKEFIDSIRQGARQGLFNVEAAANKARDALKDACKAIEKAEAESRPDKRVEAARKAMDKLEELLRRLQTMAVVPSYAQVPTMVEMIRWFRQQAQSEHDNLQKVVQGEGSDGFGARDFLPWDGKDWKRQKKAAIRAGALEDTGASGLSGAMEDALKAVKAIAKAKPKRAAQARNQAWVGWDRVYRIAHQLHARTRDANLQNYLQQCQDAAVIERDKYAEGG